MAVTELGLTKTIRFLPGLKKNYLNVLMELQHKKSDCVRIPLLKAIFISNPTYLDPILTNKTKTITKSRFIKDAQKLLGQGLTSNEGETWKIHRRIMGHDFHKERIVDYLKIFEEVVSSRFDDWDRCAKEGVPVNLSKDFGEIALQIVGRTLFGLDSMPDFKAIEKAGVDGLAYIVRNATTPFPISDWLPTPINVRFFKAVKTIDSITEKLLEKTPGSGTLISKLVEAKKNGVISKQDLIDEAKTLLFAGSETTALALSWMFYLLGKHPNYIARLQGEKLEIGLSELLSTSDLRNVLLESLRLYPPAPSFARTTTENVKIEDIELIQGETIHIVPFATHRHPDYWDEPEKFRPERFENEPKPFSFIPFAAGPRGCIGEHFAMSEAMVVASRFLSRYRFSLEDSNPILPNPVFTLRMNRPLVVKLKRV